MAEPLYKYNRKSLHYERAGFRWDRFLIKAVGSTVVTLGCLYGLIGLYTNFFQSEKQRQLVFENNAFREHKATLISEIATLHEEVSSLETAEAGIYRKLYLTGEEDEQETATLLGNSKVLEFPQSEFDEILSKTTSRIDKLKKEVSTSTIFYSSLYWPGKSDVEELRHYPTLPPIENISADNIACGFGQQINPFNKKIYLHPGLDLLAETGTNVLATGNGKVEEVHLDDIPGGSGTYILIDHGKGYKTRYSKLSTAAVRLGQLIQQGQIIGQVGKTGSSVAPHLHYEVFVAGKRVDPVKFFIKNVEPKELEMIFSRSAQHRQALD